MAYITLHSKIKINNFQKRIIDEQIYFQHELWNYLVEKHSPIIQDKLNNKIRDSLNIQGDLEKEIKEVFHDKVSQDWCAQRCFRSIVCRYIRAWKRVFQVAYTKPPRFHKWKKFDMTVVIEGIDNKPSEEKITLATTGKIARSLKRVKILDKYALEQYQSLKNAKVKCYSIRRRNGNYFINIVIEYKPSQELLQSEENMIGLDWGAKNYFTDNNGNFYNLPNRVWKYDKRINRLQRILSKKSKGSKNYIKVQKKLNDAYVKRFNLQKDWIEKSTTNLLRQHKLIGIEKLDVMQLISISNKSLRHRFQINKFGFARNRLIEKSKKYTCLVVEVDQKKFPTTQICFCCKNRHKKPLHQRTVKCPICGNDMDRDVNAAKNILYYAQLEAGFCS